MLSKHPNTDVAPEAITSFHSILFRLNGMGTMDDSDEMTRNQTRQIALLAIEAVFDSEVLSSLALEDRRRAVNVVVPPLIDNMLPGDTKLDVLEHRVLPSLNERQFFVDLEKSDAEKHNIDDVQLAAIAMRIYRHIYTQSTTGKWVAMVVKPTVDSFDKYKRWREVEWVCWVLERALRWTPPNYAAYIPMTILEMLLDSQETFPTTTKQSGYLHILTHLFSLEGTIEGLQIIAILEKLIQFLIYRFTKDKQDALAPMTIGTVGALARRLYYADQICDMVSRVISTINTIQFSDKSESRDDLLRLLLCMLAGVMATAYDGPTRKTSVDGDDTSTHSSSSDSPPQTSPKGKERAVLLPSLRACARTDTRTRVSPADMATTVSLLIEPRYSVRAGYVRALIGFIEGELKTAALGHEVKFEKFVNALNAAMWVLATCRNLADVQIEEEREDLEVDSGGGGGTLGRLKQMARHQHTTPSFPSNTATPTDYTYLLGLVTALHRRDISQALVVVVPFLRALDNYAVGVLLGPGLKSNGSRRGSHASWSANSPLHTLNVAVDERCKCRAIRELVVRCWMEIGQRWDNGVVKDLAKGGMNRLGGSVLQSPSSMDLSEVPAFTLSPPPPQLFPSEDDWDAVHDGESSRTVTAIVDELAAIDALVADEGVLATTGLSGQELEERLKVQWTFDRAIEIAGKESHNRYINDGAQRRLSAAARLSQHPSHSQRHVEVFELMEALSSKTTPNISRNSKEVDVEFVLSKV